MGVPVVRAAVLVVGPTLESAYNIPAGRAELFRAARDQVEGAR